MTIASFDRHTCRTVQEGALKALEAYAASIGLKVQSSRFGELTIIGYNFKAKSMPVQLVTADGRGVKMAVEGVRA